MIILLYTKYYKSYFIFCGPKTNSFLAIKLAAPPKSSKTFKKYLDKEIVEILTFGYDFYKKLEKKELKDEFERIMFNYMMKQSELSKRL